GRSGSRSLLFPMLPCGKVAPKSDRCNLSQSRADDPGTNRLMSVPLAPRGDGDAQSIGGTNGASQCGVSVAGDDCDGADDGDDGTGAACVSPGACLSGAL